MKFIILALLVFLFYRMVFKPKQIDRGPKTPPIQDSGTEDVDYEEID